MIKNIYQKVSFLIPYYNKGNFFERTFKSLINQNFPHELIEIIICDDCSKIEEFELLKKIVSNNKTNIDVTILQNSKNLGLHWTRKYLFENVKTPFFAFIDADDAIHKNFLIKCMKKQVKKDYDIVEAKIWWKDISFSKKNFKVSTWSMCGKIFKTEWYKKTNFTSKQFRIFEDSAFFYINKNIERKTALASFFPLYFYFHDDTNSILRTYDITKNQQNIIKCSLTLSSLFEEKGFFNDMEYITKNIFQIETNLPEMMKYIEKDNIIAKENCDKYFKKELLSLIKKLQESKLNKLINKKMWYIFFKKINTKNVNHFDFVGETIYNKKKKETFIEEYSFLRNNINGIEELYDSLDLPGKVILFYWIKSKLIFSLNEIKNIENLITSKNLQYLDTDFFTFSEEEIYINCGCYDGKDLLNFANITNNKYKFLVGIDTIKKNIEQTKNYLIKNNISNFKLLNNALGSSERTILVDQFADMSVLELKNEKNKEKIKQIILDSLKFDNKNFTFLSLDVEGYEIEVLKGASKVIETQKPKLAISIYHKPKHLIEVFKLLKDLNPEYKFSLQKIKNPGLYFTELILLAK